MVEAGPSKKPPKRRKTQNACDYCKNHKLKCDFRSEDGEGEADVCKHCSDFGITCHVTPRIKVARFSARLPQSGSVSSSTVRKSDSPNWIRKTSIGLTEPRYAGPTSLSQLVSAVTRKWPSRADQVLSRTHSRYEPHRVEGVSGGPFLMLPQVRYPPEQLFSKDMEEARISTAMKQELLTKYQRFVAPVFAILSNKESRAAIELEYDNQPISSLSNLGLAILALAAMTRSTPKETRMSILYHIRGRPQMDIISSLETIQYLLLLSANVEILSPDTNISTGMSLNLTGIVVRMAHDLGLHRDVSQLNMSKEHLNRRARIWAACIVQDRWFSLSYGQPCLIHLEDCNAPGPWPYDDEVQDAHGPRKKNKPYDMHAEHTKLGILMGRLLRLVFTPRGLQYTSIEDMERLKYDLDQWSKDLPENLRFKSRSEHRIPIGAGFLHLLKVSVDFIFYRAALATPHNKSKSASMSTTTIWRDIVKRSAEAIEWISTNDGTSVMDAWSVAMYALIQCCLVQFYAAMGGENPEPLRMARQCLQSWSSSIEAQSHGYYDPQEGDAPLPSSTTTAAIPSNPNARGKKSLTLRTKINTLIAMLAGIAEHHIASLSGTKGAESSDQIPSSSSVSSAASSFKPEEKKYHKLPSRKGPITMSSPSAFYFDAVLNHAPARPFRASGQASSNIQAPIHKQSDIHRLTNENPASSISPNQSSFIPTSIPTRMTNESTTTTTMDADATAAAPTTFSEFSNGHPNELQQIDFVTLQRWADEVMRNPPAFDIGYVPAMETSAEPPHLHQYYHHHQQQQQHSHHSGAPAYHSQPQSHPHQLQHLPPPLHHHHHPYYHSHHTQSY